MMSRLLTQFAVAACVLLGFVAASQAQPTSIGPGDGFASITYPASWEVSKIKRGVQGATKDQEVYLWAEAYTPETMDTILKEHEAYFSKQGVSMTGDATSQDVTMHGIPGQTMTVPATWNGKPTIVRYFLFDPGPTANSKLILCEWASPEGEQSYGSDLKSAPASVTFKAQ
jgi:hypothetical protein